MDPTDLVMEHLFGRVLGHHNSKSILESFTKLDILDIHDFLCTDEFGLRKSDQCILNIFKDFLNYVLNDEDLEYFSIPADAVFWLEITPESFKAFRRESFKSSSTKPTVSNDQQSVFESPNFRHRPTIHFESSARDVKRNETRSSTLGNISIQTINPAFKKAQKITEFPTFSGQVKDWKAFERRFVAIANSQNYGHVLMLNPPFEPGFDQLDEFKLDCNYIFQAFSAAWSDGSNYNIVSDHEHTRDGRAVYMNALRYFRSAAFTQIELQDSISSLVNNKLLHSTHDGAEGYNSKFNEYVTIVQKAGVHLDPTLIKCLYLANIQDELYITIKDQTGLENLSLLEIQSLMLKKYTQSLGQRREGAPRFYRQHLVSTNESQVCTPDRPTQHTSDSSTQLKLAHQPLGKPSNNNNTDPFYFDPKDWAAFSPSTREKILLLKGKLREVNIKTLSTAEETENLQPENADPFKDILSQFMIRAHRQNIVQTRNTSKILKQVVNKQYGRLISDSGADTGAISDTYAHILEVHDTQVSVDGCHPNKIETYNLCNGVVAVDLNRVTYLLGIREVPLIPNSVGVLLSELQARAHGTHVDSKPRCFGGSGCIIIKGTNEDEINIPLNLEHGLMTCPIRKPTEQELHNHDIHWITGDGPWDPSTFDEKVSSGYDNNPVLMNVNRVSIKTPDPDEVSRFFLYRPKDIIAETFKATTQLATSIGDPIMKRHYKSRFPALNRNRLQETFATDTWFSSTQAIGGFTCAQLFYGKTSRFIVIYPMKREADGPHALEDFIRDVGAPYKIKSDNSAMQSGNVWTTICRKYNIQQCFTEPHHPNQNQAEFYIGEVKRLVIVVMDRSGAPNCFWALCAVYVVYIINRMSHPLLDHRTPFERCHGHSPDISAIIHFSFYERVYFLDSEVSFPTTRERSGYFVGFAENTGDALTYLIYDPETARVLARSIVRRTDPANLRLPPTDQPLEKQPSHIPLLVGHNDLCHGPLIEFDPLDHTGYVSDESQVQNSDDRQIMDDSPVELDHLQDATLPDTDDTSRWKMSAILTHKEVGPHRTELEVQWDTGEISWLPLSVVKRAEPLLFGEYALKSHGPWANHYRKKRRQLLTQLRQASKQNSSSKSHVYKYGVRIPRSAREAHEIDKTEGNTLWGDAILKEINKINEYEVFKPSDIIPEEYTKLRCNMIFDVKLDGTRKARLVVDGSHSPCTIDAYSSVIAPEHVRLAMVAGTLNNLLMETIDLGNAYLHAFTKELVYTILSDGYGQLSGKILIIQKALYGMRTSGARFHEDLSETLLSIGFKPSKADSDLWIRQGQHCYEYIARYVDDLMIFAKDPASVIKALGEKYPVQAGSENLYLGGDIIRSEGHMFLNAKTYIKNVCSKIENLCELTLKHFDTPMATDDHPETDDTTVLDEKTHSIYRLLIGSAQWTITLGRFDIMYAVATLSRFAQVPHQGHFDRMLRVFGYLKYHADLGISMNPIISSFPSSSTPFNPQSWKEQYPNAHEEIPDDAPTPLGRSIKIVTHVDASHASNLLNRRSTTGFIVLANGIPVYWHSKEQHTIETSTFGSEIVAGRIAAEKIMEYRYKLRMMGIPIDGPAILFCDNKSVVTSCSVLSSSLKKRHNALAYHKLRECVAADIIHIFHVPGKNNIADILTKPVDGTTFKHHRGRLLSNPTL